jgi:hypothetical protein
VEADGEEIIAVRRSNLTEEQKTRLALYDNRAAELAEWDGNVLAGVAQDAPGMLDGIFAAGELAGLLPSAPKPRFAFGDGDSDELDEFDPDSGDNGEFDESAMGEVESQVRMAQLFLTVATFPEYADLVERLRGHFGVATATDAVLEGLRRACASLEV